MLDNYNQGFQDDLQSYASAMDPGALPFVHENKALKSIRQLINA